MRQVLLLIVCVLFLSSCQNTSSQDKGPVTHFQGIAMTIPYKITIGKQLAPSEQKRVESIVDRTFAEVDRIYNKWNPYSELSALNNLSAKVVAEISPALEQFLALTGKIHRITQGRFDPTMEPLHALWKKRLESNTVPSQQEIETLFPMIGWDKIHFHEGKFYKDHDLVCIDLSGIAKGFCVDLLTERLAEGGYPDLFVEWGGEVKAIGKHPTGRPWTVYISRLCNTDPQCALAIVPLENQALATSGDYLQNWTIFCDEPGGYTNVTYTHIIDPFTKTPLIATHESIATASVLAESCAVADGLATGAMIFKTPQEARAWALTVQAEIPEVQFWIASRDELKNEDEEKQNENGHF